ncbi:MAG: DUF3311 domain-containing protein [Anaerovoracaceae bacterium]
MKNRLLTVIIGLVVPLCAVTVCFPLYNRIEPFVFGFSFNYFWIFAWLFLTSLCLYIAFKLDPLNREDAKALGDKKLEDVKAIIAAEEKTEEVKK